MTVVDDRPTGIGARANSRRSASTISEFRVGTITTPMTTAEVTEFDAHQRIVQGRRGRFVSVLADLRERFLASMGRGEASTAR
jgi:hypothetical protein